jgi:hypothetical protein
MPDESKDTTDPYRGELTFESVRQGL